MTAKAPVDASLLAQQGQTKSAAGARPTKADARSEAQAAKAAEEFEAMFLAQMLSPIFQTLEGNSYFGGGPGEDVYRSMMVEEYGKTLAKSGGVGIADDIKAEILKLQEVK